MIYIYKLPCIGSQLALVVAEEREEEMGVVAVVVVVVVAALEVMISSIQ